MASGMTERAPYTPRFPHLMALLAVTVFVAVLGFPFFTGQFLVGPHSDQYVAGYGFRQFWTEYVRLHGSVGLNRLWAQIEAEGPVLELPLYRGRFAGRSPTRP